MKESVIYQDIVQKQALKMINRYVKKCFGNVNDSLTDRIENLFADDLEDLGEALLDFSEVADLVIWLEQREKGK